MEPLPRHRCLVYGGTPARHLAALAAVILDKRRQHYRCFYLNSRPAIDGLRSRLAAAGMDVLTEIANGSLILTAERTHLRHGKFDVRTMIQTLRDSLDEARDDGYSGLWASGDMSWEFGAEKDFSQLLEYEWQLEELFRERPDLSGICQYQAGTLPHEFLLQGFTAHPSLFLNENLSCLNRHHLSRDSFSYEALTSPDVDPALRSLLRGEAGASPRSE